MKTIARVLAFILGVSLGIASVTGCSGTSQGSGPSTATAAEPLTSACSGAYQCTLEGMNESFGSLLQLKDGVCYAGKIELRTDGHAVTDDGDASGTWTGDSQKFQLCEGTTCVDCTRQGDAPGT